MSGIALSTNRAIFHPHIINPKDSLVDFKTKLAVNYLYKIELGVD